MSSFDDFSHRKGFPAGMELHAELNMNAWEGEIFGDLPILVFVSRFRRHLDRGLKWAILCLSIRTAIERQSARGNGNRWKRRLCARRVLADFKAEAIKS